MSREDGTAEGAGQPPRFARLLNRLFLTRLATDPNGLERPYTLREVAQGTGISIGYLSEARRGGIENPSADKIELLAAFFGVRPGYFFGEAGEEPRDTERVAPDHVLEGGPPELHSVMREALEEPVLGQIILSAGALSAVERSMVLELLNRFAEVRRLKSDLAARKQDQERPGQGKGS